MYGDTILIYSMKRLKKTCRRFALILLIIIAAMIPVPILFQKKEGYFDQENKIELVDTKEEDTHTKTLKEEDFKS